MAHMDRIHKEYTKKINKIAKKTFQMNKAFSVYVKNNGVSPEVKKIVCDILED